jgi:hypothetical protein
MIKLFMLICVFSQIKDFSPDKKWDIEIVTKKTEQYSLLVKGEPITLTVEGPTYLRVYTRIPWSSDFKGSKIYKIILQDNIADEQIKTFESEKSAVTKDKFGRPLSKWRSFYLEVDEGMNTYKLMNWYSPNDTILVKVKYEAPKKWKDIPATNYNSILEAIESEKIVKYYGLTDKHEVTLGISGPARLKVVSRLSYTSMVAGEQNYTILVDDKGKTDNYTIKCYKSETIRYKNRQDLVPSNARSFYINVNAGWHVLKFSLTGSIAKEAALRFQVED